ncbi:MAG TPA: DUF2306 domain-containing protein [Actinophytocola sp.]|uniref:DUF2306 domain-containing protein n=1 Tax=Actinophytocola sp. TaxID=1872138 RepID=UPI002DBE2258|nr:DUF2306 domain-containing protein [Actinophytocola sp.]HEU5475571.1 DUF2306 domain-containing protein [Actinophytocola sp.]
MPKSNAVMARPDEELTGRRSWWTRPGVVLVWAVVIWFIWFSVPPYLTLDPATVRIPRLRTDIPAHFPLLVAHIWFGTLTLITVCVQVVPAIRRHFPAVHRWSGRVYVFAGMLPTALAALAIVPFSAGPGGNAVAAILWLITTFVGFRAARRRDWAGHRRWMIYSFALALQIVWGRVLLLTLSLFPSFTFADPNNAAIVLETATWIGFVINLLAAQVYLEWSAKRAARAPEIRPAGIGTAGEPTVRAA